MSLIDNSIDRVYEKIYDAIARGDEHALRQALALDYIRLCDKFMIPPVAPGELIEYETLLRIEGLQNTYQNFFYLKSDPANKVPQYKDYQVFITEPKPSDEYQQLELDAKKRFIVLMNIGELNGKTTKRVFLIPLDAGINPPKWVWVSEDEAYAAANDQLAAYNLSSMSSSAKFANDLLVQDESDQASTVNCGSRPYFLTNWAQWPGEPRPLSPSTQEAHSIMQKAVQHHNGLMLPRAITRAYSEMTELDLRQNHTFASTAGLRNELMASPLLDEADIFNDTDAQNEDRAYPTVGGFLNNSLYYAPVSAPAQNNLTDFLSRTSGVYRTITPDWLTEYDRNISLGLAPENRSGGRNGNQHTNDDVDALCPPGVHLGLWQEYHYVFRERTILNVPSTHYNTLLQVASKATRDMLTDGGYMDAQGNGTAKNYMVTQRVPGNLRIAGVKWSTPAPGPPGEVSAVHWNEAWRAAKEHVSLPKRGGSCANMVRQYFNGGWDRLAIKRILKQQKPGISHGYVRP